MSWTKGNGEYTHSQKKLGMRLKERGFEEMRMADFARSRGWKGLRVVQKEFTNNNSWDGGY